MKINGCETTSKIWIKMAWLVAALFLTLWFPSKASAEVVSENKEVNVTEVMEPSKTEDMVNLMDFNKIELNFNRDIMRDDVKIIISEVDSLIKEYNSIIEGYKNEYSQYYDSLPDNEKQNFIRTILKEDKEIRRVVWDMLKDPDIIKAMNLWDKKFIEKEFIGLIWREKRWLFYGIIAALLYGCTSDLLLGRSRERDWGKIKENLKKLKKYALTYLNI